MKVPKPTSVKKGEDVEELTVVVIFHDYVQCDIFASYTVKGSICVEKESASHFSSMTGLGSGIDQGQGTEAISVRQLRCKHKSLKCTSGNCSHPCCKQPLSDNIVSKAPKSSSTNVPMGALDFAHAHYVRNREGLGDGDGIRSSNHYLINRNVPEDGFPVSNLEPLTTQSRGLPAAWAKPFKEPHSLIPTQNKRPIAKISAASKIVTINPQSNVQNSAQDFHHPASNKERQDAIGRDQNTLPRKDKELVVTLTHTLQSEERESKQRKKAHKRCM